jgi:hypothetical protein
VTGPGSGAKSKYQIFEEHGDDLPDRTRVAWDYPGANDRIHHALRDEAS